MKNIFFITLSILFFSACGNNTVQEKEKDFDKMAIDLCSCMRPLADMNVRMKKLVEQGKNQEVAALFPEVEKISQEGESCAKSLEEIYGIVTDVEEPKATAAIRKHCSDIAQMLERSKTMEQ